VGVADVATVAELAEGLADAADRHNVLVGPRDARGAGAGRVAGELRAALVALVEQRAGGTRDELPTSERQLARVTGLGARSSRRLVDQCWPMLNRLALVLLVERGSLPAPRWQSLATWTAPTAGRPRSGWIDRGRPVMTVAIQTAAVPGVGELPLDAVIWEPADPETSPEMRSRRACRIGRSARRPLTSTGAVATALFQEQQAFHQMLAEGPLRENAVLGRQVPFVVEGRRLHMPAGEASPRDAEGDDVEAVLEAAARHGFTTSSTLEPGPGAEPLYDTLDRFFAAVGAPFRGGSPSTGARLGMLGLGCAVNLLTVGTRRPD
jgi:hypothetical protein